MTGGRPVALRSGSPEATEALGRLLGRLVSAGDVLALVGPLGAGKTCLARGIAAGLGVGGRVASPSFIVARWHPGPTPLVHADAYRLADARELTEAGLDEWVRAAVVVVEWADRVAAALPDDRLTVALRPEGDGRVLVFTAAGPRGEAVLAAFLEAVAGDGAGSGHIELAGEPGPDA
jgi:tRNA threonylcarbamoyladenosine biosynthesis protein TsaE